MEKESDSPFWTRFAFLVIGILCALLVLAICQWLPALFKKYTSHQPQAKNDAMQVRQAIETYFTEYHQYPVENATIETPSHAILSDHKLMDILLGSDAAASPGGLNPRGIVFFAGRKARGKPPKSGVALDVDGRGELFDLWGNHYRVLIDLNADDQIAAPSWAKDQTPIPQSVIVWSPGPDGKDETEDDNITTW